MLSWIAAFTGGLVVADVGARSECRTVAARNHEISTEFTGNTIPVEVDNSDGSVYLESRKEG